MDPSTGANIRLGIFTAANDDEMDVLCLETTERYKMLRNYPRNPSKEWK